MDKPQMEFSAAVKFGLVDALVFAILLGLRIAGYPVSWLLVLLPLWGPFALFAVVIGIYFCAVAVFESTVATNEKIGARAPNREEEALLWKQAALPPQETESNDASDATVGTGPSSSWYEGYDGDR